MNPTPVRPTTPGHLLKKTGIIVLLAGCVIAGIIYLFDAPEPASEENSMLSQYYKNQESQAQRLWGTQGSLLLEISRLFQRPGTYSVIVIVLSMLAALVCFYLASHPPENDAEKKTS